MCDHEFKMQATDVTIMGIFREAKSTDVGGSINIVCLDNMGIERTHERRLHGLYNLPTNAEVRKFNIPPDKVAKQGGPKTGMALMPWYPTCHKRKLQPEPMHFSPRKNLGTNNQSQAASLPQIRQPLQL